MRAGLTSDLASDGREARWCAWHREAGDRFFDIMLCVEGESLGDRLWREGCVVVEEALRPTQEMAEALR